MWGSIRVDGPSPGPSGGVFVSQTDVKVNAELDIRNGRAAPGRVFASRTIERGRMPNTENAAHLDEPPAVVHDIDPG